MYYLYILYCIMGNAMIGDDLQGLYGHDYGSVAHLVSEAHQSECKRTPVGFIADKVGSQRLAGNQHDRTRYT